MAQGDLERAYAKVQYAEFLSGYAAHWHAYLTPMEILELQKAGARFDRAWAVTNAERFVAEGKSGQYTVWFSATKELEAKLWELQQNKKKQRAHNRKHK